MPTDIPLWDRFLGNHWLRGYGRTQVMVIDDIWHNEAEFILTSTERKELEAALNVNFHFFNPPASHTWNENWFTRELETAKKECPNPAMVLLDLMFGKKEKTPLEGSGRQYLNILSKDERFKDIPVLVITAGEKNERLLSSLKAQGGPFETFLNKNSITKESLKLTLLEWALLSDPNINAFSIKMRAVAQKMRKVAMDNTLTEPIQNNRYMVPKSVLFIGESGSGKNYLSQYLHSISNRRNQVAQSIAFTDINPHSVESTLFGAGPSSNTPARYHLDVKTGDILNGIRPHNLAVIGAVTNARGSTIILDELGNSPAEIHTKLLRFLDDRQILPQFWAAGCYVPSNGFYDIWVIMTMQPLHREKLSDLSRRLSKMTQIKIPDLCDRCEDVIPLSVFAMDNSIGTPPEDLFTPDGIAWLNQHGPDFTVSILTSTIISNLKLTSAEIPYNADELEKAKGNIRTTKAGSAIENENRPPTSEISIKRLFEQGKLNDYYLETVNYVRWALEKSKDPKNNEPNYVNTWHCLTGETKSSSTCQRNIGNIIFHLPNRELLNLMQESAIFIGAVVTCGQKVQSAVERLKELATLMRESPVFEDAVKKCISKCTSESKPKKMYLSIIELLNSKK